MKIAELDRAVVAKEIRAWIEKRRPGPELRHKLDYGFRYHNRSVELLEIRPMFDSKAKKATHAFAKARYIGTREIWKGLLDARQPQVVSLHAS